MKLIWFNILIKMKKLISIIIALFFLLPSLASAQIFRVNQVISPVGQGVVMSSGIGTSTLTASSSPSFVSINATSTTATSTFLGNIMVGNAFMSGRLANTGVNIPGLGLNLTPNQIQASTNTNNFVDGVAIYNTAKGAATGFAAATCYGMGNASTTEAPANGSASYYGLICFSGPDFSLYPGLASSSLAIQASDGSIVNVTSTSSERLNGQYWAIGPGYTSTNYDMSLVDLDHTIFPGASYLANLGLASSSPFARYSEDASSTNPSPHMWITSSTNCTISSPCPNRSTLFYISPTGSVGIGTSSPYKPLSVVGTGGVVAESFTGTSTTVASTLPYASTTAISVSGLTSGKCVQASTGGLLTTTGVACGGSGSQTPWTGNIDGAGFNLSDAGAITGTILTATSTTLASTLPYASTTAISVSGLTSGNCVQASTGGLLTTSAGACGGSGTNFFSNSGASTYLSTGSQLGVGTTTPLGLLTVAASTYNASIPMFLVASTTAGGGATSTPFMVDGKGNSYIATTTTGTTNQFVVQNSNVNTNIAQFFSSTGASRLMLSEGGTLTTQAITSNAITETGASIFTSNAVGNIALITRGASALQTGDIQQWFKNNAANAQIGEVSPLGRFGLGTTTPWGQLSVSTTTAGLTNPLFVMSTSTLNGLSTSTPFIVDQNGNTGLGTSTPFSKLHVTSGANATTTISIGEIGLTSSKACVNMNRSDGGAGSFYINSAGALTSEANYCR